MNWDAVFAELRRRYNEALVRVPRPNGFPIAADTELTTYPPRIHVDVRVPSADGRRREVYPGIGETPLVAELTDDELRAMTDYAMQFYRACGDGLKIYRDRRPARGIVRFTIKPARYEDFTGVYND